MRRLRFGLRAKLLVAVIVIQGLMLTFLVKGNLLVLQDELTAQMRSQADSLRPLLNAALAGPLAAQDIGAIDEIMRSVQQAKGLRYLSLADSNGHLVASVGLVPGTPLPTLDKDPGQATNGVFNTAVDLEISGQKLGQLRYGMGLEMLDDTLGQVRKQGLAIAAAIVTLSTVLILFSTLWLSRRLRGLTDASRAIARGQYDAVQLPTGDDDIGQLAIAFRHMANALRLRIEEADQEHARLEALITTMRLGILFVGPDTRVIYLNPAFGRIWQTPAANALIGTPVRKLFPHGFSAPGNSETFDQGLERSLATREASEMIEIGMADGRLVTQQSHPVLDSEGRFIGHLFVYEDVTKERQDALQLVSLAEHDSLTGLYNRHRFQNELARAVDEAFRSRGTCALLFFDLDEFKAINDHFGHGAGDALLIRVAHEVSRVARRHESLFRLGGDEFAIVLAASDLDQASVLAHRVVHAISGITLSFEGKSLRISSSLGIAVYPEQAHDAEQLVAYADAAMYQAKQAGKNTWRVYRADLDATPETLHRLTWNERLADAIVHDRLVLHFQGVHHALHGTLHHLEALVRLRDEKTGELIMPGQFIPVAEKSHKIVEIDRWVLRNVIRMLSQSPAAPPIAVNLSGRSFDNPALPDYIASLLHEYGVDPRLLLIEITETAAVSDLTDAQRFIEAIRAAGCQVYLDDFGAGFASFAYLKHLDVDAIKIDGMFIRNLADDHDNQVLVHGMVEVARGLDKITVAECVEDETVLRLLADMGVTLVQGYHLDRPMADHPAFGTADAQPLASAGAGQV